MTLTPAVRRKRIGGSGLRHGQNGLANAVPPAFGDVVATGAPRRRLLNQSGVGAYLYGMVGSMAVQVADLVQAAATGDEAAFTELVSRHHQDMLRVAYVICREPALAEDAAQAAWTIAWRRMGEVKDPTQSRGLLSRVRAHGV